MATPSAGLYARLSGFAGLTALVSTRIYPGVVPQEQVEPAVAFVRIDEPEEVEAMGENADILETRFEVTSLGPTYDSCEAVHEQVRAACRRFRGTVGGLEITDTLLREGEGPLALDDPPTYEATQDVLVRYRRV